MGNCRSEPPVDLELVYAKEKCGRANFFNHNALSNFVIWYVKKDLVKAVRHAER
jgi:hypothetical protein